MSKLGEYPVVPNLDSEMVDFDIARRRIRQVIDHAEIRNIDVEVNGYLDHVAVTLTQRLLAKTADVVDPTREVRSTTDKREAREFEVVPANWWSHILVAIVGGVSVPDGYGWRWWVLKHAKLRTITIGTHYYYDTRHTYFTKVTRMCPHVHIPDNINMHMRWVQYAGIDDGKYREGY